MTEKQKCYHSSHRLNTISYMRDQVTPRRHATCKIFLKNCPLKSHRALETADCCSSGEAVMAIIKYILERDNDIKSVS